MTLTPSRANGSDEDGRVDDGEKKQERGGNRHADDAADIGHRVQMVNDGRADDDAAGHFRSRQDATDESHAMVTAITMVE